MTAYNLQLKKRINKATVSMPLAQIAMLIDMGEQDGAMALWRTFRNFDTRSATVHDKFWLEMLVNWVPKDGLKLTEMGKWMKLATRVAGLDDEREGNFSLSDFQVNLLWTRITDDRFIMSQPMQSSFVEFVTMFQDVTGKHFPDEDPTTEE